LNRSLFFRELVEHKVDQPRHEPGEDNELEVDREEEQDQTEHGFDEQQEQDSNHSGDREACSSH